MSKFGSVPVEMTDELRKHMDTCRFSRIVQESEATSMPMAAFLPIGNDALLSFAMPTSEIGPKTMRRIARKLSGAAASVSYLALLRGENDDDLVGTIEAANYAATFLSTWATALSEIADSGLYGGADLA